MQRAHKAWRGLLDNTKWAAPGSRHKKPNSNHAHTHSSYKADAKRAASRHEGEKGEQISSSPSTGALRGEAPEEHPD